VKAVGAKGVTNQRSPKESTGNTGGYGNVEHELKEIRYQSRSYAKLETLMNRVGEGSLKEEHRKQVQRKAVADIQILEICQICVL
jgi:hypothetical protein